MKAIKTLVSKKKIYTIEVIFQVGKKDFNDLISCFDLGISGLYRKEKAIITTITKPSKKLFTGYEKAIKKAHIQSGYEAINFKFQII